LQAANAKSSMDITDDGKVILLKFWLNVKAESPITVTGKP
jgi:hypothetical protein